MRGGAKRLAALAVASICAANLAIPGGAYALRDDVFTSLTQPANTLLIPFDVTDDHQTYIQVSNPHGTSSSSAPKVTTHWAFWSDSCDHLLDVSICLTLQDTIVVDPRNVTARNEKNEPIGPVADLSGERGFVTVTAYATDDECGAPDVLGFKLVDNAIVGLVTLADDGTDAAVGFDAIGLGLDPTGAFVDLPDQLLSPDAGDGFLDIQTLPIPDLEVAQVIYLAVAENSGKLAGEIGPIGRTVTAAATFIDTLEIPLSLPSVSISCARFASLHSTGDDPLVPPTVTIESSGIFRLTNIFAGSAPVGDDDGQNGNDTWLYGAFMQQLGPFGSGSRAKYPVISSDGQPTPRPTPTVVVTPTVAPTVITPTATPVGPTPGRPTPTAAGPTPSASGPTPSARPTAGPTAGASCTQAELTITLAFDANDASGANVQVDYPASVSIPSTGNQPPVLARVTNLTGVNGGLFSAGDQDANPNDATIAVGLVSISQAIPAGPYARVTFDCGGAAPRLADFNCLPDVSSTLGNPIAATCTLALRTTP